LNVKHEYEHKKHKQNMNHAKRKRSTKSFKKTKMVQHQIASNNNNQPPRIKHQAMRMRFAQIFTCLELCFVLLVLKLSLATLCSKPPKSLRSLWSLRLFQLLGSLGRDWWWKNESFLLVYVFSKKWKKWRKLVFFLGMILFSISAPPDLSCAAAVNEGIYSVVFRLRDGEWG
jgi:hypothetical protein